MRDLEDEERIKAYMAAKMAHIKMYNECMNLADGLDVEKFAELVRADEREACAKICDAQAEKDTFEGCYANACAEAIRARSEKPPVKTYCGGKPNYCTPHVDAVNMSQERVDETAKREHEPWCDSVTKLLLSMPPQIPPCNCKLKNEQGNSSLNYHIAESNTPLDKIVEMAIQGHASTRDAIRWAMQQEREACAKLVEADGLARGDEGLVLIKAAGRIRARGNHD